MGNMNEMPGMLKIDPAERAANALAREAAGARNTLESIADDTEENVSEKIKVGGIDIEKQKRAKKYADEIAGLEAELERVRVAASKAGDMAHNFDKLISSIKSEIAAKEIEFAGEAGTDIAN